MVSVSSVVCPPKLHHKVFSIAAFDHLDHNLTSATATDSFHCTGISIIQHLSHDADRVDCGVMVINPDISFSTISRSIVPLPWIYTNVPPAALRSKEFIAPSANSSVMLATLKFIAEAKKKELEWCNTVMTALEKEQLDPTHWISLSAYHAALQQTVKPAAIIALLPLITDSVHSIARKCAVGD